MNKKLLLALLAAASCLPAAAKDLTLSALQTALKSSDAKWTAGETKFSNLTPKQGMMLLGLSFAPIAAPEIPRPTEAASALLPKSWDWREHDGVSAVRDQGQCGSCWSFSMTGALESYVKITQKKKEDVALSEQVMLSCSGVGSCNGGTMDASFLQKTGLPPEADYPYAAADGKCELAKPGWQDHAVRIGSWRTVDQDLGAIKAALVTYGPLPTAFVVYEDFMKFYKSGVYSYTKGKPLGGHAVLLVGYNDDEKYFIVKNSWGPGWGEDGYFRIAYSQMESPVGFGDSTLVYMARQDPPVAAANAPKKAEADDWDDLFELEKSARALQLKAAAAPPK